MSYLNLRKILVNTNKITIIFLVIISLVQLRGQTFCLTPPYSSNMNYHSLLKTKQVDRSFCIKIYIHVIRQSDGSGGPSVGDINTAVSYLDSDFNPHEIFFNWDNVVDYINNDIYYSTPTTAIFDVNNHEDGIDIYLFDDESSAGGRANGVGESSEFWISGSFWDEPFGSLVKSHVISHEMGHVLFLWHTHHGTYYEGGNDTGQCAELVDGTNSSSCGDYISDTPADPHLQFDVDHINCNWNSSGTDANGDNYNPDETLIMSYTHPDCMSNFTNEQGERMRNALDTLPYLIDTLVDCDNNCPENIYLPTTTINSDETELHQASNTIENYGYYTINSGGDATLKATNIVLKPGFNAKEGSTFRAEIDPCE